MTSPREHPVTDFWAMLGPDFAGKSTVLDRLHREHGWRVVSYDDQYTGPHAFIRNLRRSWLTEAYPGAGGRYSAELVLAALHPIVLHLRDELARAADAQTPVIVDSYYYKLLAKCRLLGLEHQPTFDSWRALPGPRGIVYLDVPAPVAWARSGHGAELNVFEHHGPAPTEAGFLRLQTRLRAALLAETAGVPVTFVDGTAAPDEVLAATLEAVGLVPAL
jgi:thymidylate kinase